jgi:antitoxin HicB
VTISPDDNGTFLVTFPDVPDAVTYGDTIQEALERAPEALLTIFDAYMKDRRDIPVPSSVREIGIELPPLETAKIELYRAMRAARVGKAELGRRLHWRGPQVDRVLNVRHASQLDQMDQAFAVLGKRLHISVDDAPPPVHPGVLATAAKGTGRTRARIGRSNGGARGMRVARKAAKKR